MGARTAVPCAVSMGDPNGWAFSALAGEPYWRVKVVEVGREVEAAVEPRACGEELGHPL